MNVQLREAETARHYTQTERNKLARSWYTKTRYDFQTFRYIMRPKMLRAWWQEDVAYHLMQVLPRLRCRQASQAHYLRSISARQSAGIGYSNPNTQWLDDYG